MSTLNLPKTALDELELSQKREFLLDLAKTEEPTLSMVGGSPAGSAVYVVDTIDELGVGSEDDALKAYAYANGLEVVGPTPVKLSPFESDVSFEVHIGTVGSELSILTASKVYDMALQAMRQALRDLCGDRVLGIKTWAEYQNAVLGGLDMDGAGGKPQKARLTPFVEWERANLKMLPMSKSMALIANETEPKKLRRNFAYSKIMKPQGLASRFDGALVSGWEVSILKDDDNRYANHHDLLAALRLGLDIEDIKPWPYDVAHTFLVLEELRIAMKARGYVQLDDFDPSRTVHLRTSLLEFSAHITGEEPQGKERVKRQEKPIWPPSSMEKQRVVIILNRARLAFEEEPEWEHVSIRNIISSNGLLWVERDGPVEKRKAKKAEAELHKKKSPLKAQATSVKLPPASAHPIRVTAQQMATSTASPALGQGAQPPKRKPGRPPKTNNPVRHESASNDASLGSATAGVAHNA